MSMLSGGAWAQLPTSKVDLSIGNRSDDETLEPGYTVWRVVSGQSDALTLDGITYTFSVPEGAEYQIRTGWNKTFIQNADNKAKNGRLTGDGLSLDPATACGQIDLTITGLPKGTHSLQTYHSRWENPANFAGWPIFVKVNGEVVHSKATTNFWQNIAANACLLTTRLDVPEDGAPVTVSFYTVDDQTPDNVGERPNFNKAPIINGFELNTVSIVSQAKNPSPASGDMHVEADEKLLLTWEPANDKVVSHHIYFGNDSLAVANSTTPMARQSQTTYEVSNLYSMETNYWRIDEETSDGTVTKGNVWTFRKRQLAFPGAEGYGRFATGGRGGIVYHVTNLSDDENLEGSLRYGLVTLKGPRTIVFDVSGIIDMGYRDAFINSYCTIAPQTAPGKGICLKHASLNVNSENICRFLRAKRGYGGADNTGNAMGATGANHSIIDHCTLAWGTDETFSSRGAKNHSFQYNIIAEALGIADHKNYSAGTNHGYAATIDGKIGSHHHNYLVNCSGRNWSMGGGMDGQNKAIGQMDLFNNVVYNWKSRTTDGGCHEVNFVNNYYKMGPDTSLKILYSQDYENIGTIDSKWQAYVSGNVREEKNHSIVNDKLNDTYRYTLKNGAVDPNKRTDEYAYKTFVDKPFFPSYATIHTAKQAFKIVTSDAGATMPCRDNQHKRVTEEGIKGTYTYTGSKSGIKGEIDREYDITQEANGGWEEWPEEQRAADWDTDRDGMPDWYEQLVGTNPSEADNNADPDKDGWTVLEDYLEFVSHPYLIINAGAKATYDCAQNFGGFTNAPQYTIAGSGDAFTASISGSTITVNAQNIKGIGKVTMTVTDAEGDTFSQQLGIAVVNGATDITAPESVGYGEVLSREFYGIDGKKAAQLIPAETYLMKETYSDGTVRTVKIMAE